MLIGCIISSNFVSFRERRLAYRFNNDEFRELSKGKSVLAMLVIFVACASAATSAFSAWAWTPGLLKDEWAAGLLEIVVILVGGAVAGATGRLFNEYMQNDSQDAQERK